MRMPLSMVTKAAAAATLALAIPSIAAAHVSVWPRESTQGATERYTVRVPTEGKVATTSVDLEVPEGVIIETFLAPAGWKYDVKRKDDRVISITWTHEVKPLEYIEYGFVARNPREGTQIVWTLRQHFADGTTSDWTHNKGNLYPTAVTRLNPRPAPAAATPQTR